ncbi:helix-turn-helix domain-containing protein [Xylanimonas ulmi]|uniref:Helix-turn-helix protein n=1 Tax=Xylanimonas ulmi TaxID=228973 RepID=A0A4Q7LY27_9MICO|nr:helix-turn-helix domain-containing protein [Xylanibacterium ulmi]RZS60036.1 helix-turn-helix protein [Xylanibacterium ulmi]
MEVYNARSLPRLGSSVKSLRLARGLTQATLASSADVSRQTVVALEAGKTRGMEIGVILRVLDALDASLLIRDDLETR